MTCPLISRGGFAKEDHLLSLDKIVRFYKIIKRPRIRFKLLSSISLLTSVSFDGWSKGYTVEVASGLYNQYFISINTPKFDSNKFISKFVDDNNGYGFFKYHHTFLKTEDGGKTWIVLNDKFFSS